MSGKKKDTLNPVFICIICILFVFQSFSTGCIERDTKENIISNHQKQIKNDVSLKLPDWVNEDYHDYKKTTQLLTDFEKTYPDLVKMFPIGKSMLERDIWCIKITNEKNTSQKKSCVIDGCIHGNEWESGEICLYLAEYLLINFNVNRSINQILNKSIIYLIPLLNPDGREQDNRYNDNGVDLNRNFDVHFGRLRSRNYPLGKLFGFIKIPYIILPLRKTWFTNCGRSPFSEPETSALKQLMDSIDPNSLSFYVNCHTAVHIFTSVNDVEHKPEFVISDHERNVLNTALSWVEEHTQYSSHPVGDFSLSGAGFSHHWTFKEYHITSFLFELLSKDYEPGFMDGGPHDDLVFWMQESLPVLLYLLVNIEELYQWDMPVNEPILPL